MPIPNAQQLMIPYLRIVSDGREYHRVDVRNRLLSQLSLTDKEKSELLPSGLRPKINDRISWANTLLAKAKLLSRTRRGYVQITDEGRKLLSTGIETVDRRTLISLPGIQEWRNEIRRPKDEIGESKSPDIEDSPEERIDDSIKELKDSLRQSLLEIVKGCTPDFFERLVVKLLVKMGYGGTEAEAIAEVVGGSGDGGIDGIIQEDVLGLGSIYVQAKRYTDNKIGQGAIRDFSGSLDHHGAKKGVFITTSCFSEDAKQYVATARTDKKIVLIDGDRLAELMIDYGVGVTTTNVYEIKRVDTDFFEED